ncbi:LOW QUALITY PROTEIN: natural cytotoxicity triggering receptor 1 [Manis javanica]|uniref:LOW QUALITY PROTEIN: natural cytotoxicity triggering receptor 1 n=1 Tax=Manis javanica TaxID=9974 RepID=UPI003C6D9CEA
MPSALPALLCLGLYLSQRISGQTQTLWKPVIWAQPNFMVPKGRPVTIWCQGARGAVEYQLYFEGRLLALERQKSPGVMSKVKFSLLAMTPFTVWQYSCLYQSGELWSETSDPLDLVVTEMYDTPTLSVHPGPQVVSGKNVTFYCHLETATSTFFLLKEGRPGRPQRRRHGSSQVAFLLGPVSTAHRGTYRCFGSYNNHAWSFPSEPMRLLVTGDVGDSSLAPTELTSSDSGDPPLLTTEAGFQQDLALWNHMAQNLLRIGLDFLVLMALRGLLAEEWLCRKRAREQANTASSWEGRRRFKTRTFLNK